MTGKEYKTIHKRNTNGWSSLTVQWLGLRTFTADGTGSIPGWGTKIPQVQGQKKKKRKNKWLSNVKKCLISLVIKESNLKALMKVLSIKLIKYQYIIKDTPDW